MTSYVLSNRENLFRMVTTKFGTGGQDTLLTNIAFSTGNLSRQSILKQGFQKTHFPMVLEVEFFLLSIWLTSRRCAKFQIPISILTCFFRHLNMAFLGYFTQFRITVLARFCAIFIIFLTGSLLFPVIFSIEL